MAMRYAPWTPDQQRTTPRRAARCAASGERLPALLEMAAYPATFAPLTKRQQNQPLMVNALLSVVVYFV